MKAQMVVYCRACREHCGHTYQNPHFHPKDDNYTADILKIQYNLHKTYVVGRIQSIADLKIKVRLPSIPEDISENLVKFIIQNKLNDTTSKWKKGNTKKKLPGDLFSDREGVQECKCFTSDGPPSFTPSSDWDVIYFLDARDWLNDTFVLYRIPLKRTSNEWKNIQVNTFETFGQHCEQGRRPRITWEKLYPQISSHCRKVFEGSFNDIFTPNEVAG